MKKFTWFIFSALFMVTVFGCDKNDEQINQKTGEFAYFTFGHFYGECGGEACVEIYRLDAAQLQEDTTDVYPNSSTPYDGSFIVLPQDKFELVKEIIEYFPEELYGETNNVLGIPDGGDWGGIYVEINYINDEARSGFWLLDQNSYNMPDVYNAFVARINEKIILINQ